MSLWKNRDFLKLWAGQAISEIGSRITREGLPMAAVLMMGVTPLTMSGLSLTTQLPASVVGLFVGVWVDRRARRPLMMLTDVLRAVLLIMIPLAAMFGVLKLWMFFVVAAIMGILSLVFEVASSAYLPWLIARPNLMEGNSKLGVTSSTAEILGPSLTGMLVEWLTAPKAILFDAVSYLLSAGLLWSIRAREARPALELPEGAINTHESEQSGLKKWTQELRDGFSVLKQNPILMALAAVAATSGFASSAVFVLDTLYALKTLHLTAFLFGLTVTMGGAGAFFGAVVTKPLTRALGVGWTMIVTLGLQGLAAVGWVLAGGSILRVMICLLAWQLFGDAFGTVYEILDATLRQTLVSDAFLGRVNATIRVGQFALTALGTLLAGILGETIGIRSTFACAAAAMMLTTLWLIFSPIRKLVAMPEASS